MSEEIKHSPGPWEVETGHDKMIVVYGNSGEWESFYCEVQDDDCCGETALANAHLIAAAPDLLEIAEAVKAGGMSYPKYLRDKAAAAIAKAKGAA